MSGPKGLSYYMHRASHNFLYVFDIHGHADFQAALPAAANLFLVCGARTAGNLSGDELSRTAGRYLSKNELNRGAQRFRTLLLRAGLLGGDLGLLQTAIGSVDQRC
ncbi:hypothetical protein IQ06DRAFT_42503 [Phaeosphaeriaceae sp. SRC1lsM3a]|nr:hypothetical protein IQ06DRAFT_42503 [Stagonospora sp. SRC1lsM3a]